MYIVLVKKAKCKSHVFLSTECIYVYEKAKNVNLQKLYVLEYNRTFI